MAKKLKLKTKPRIMQNGGSVGDPKKKGTSVQKRLDITDQLTEEQKLRFKLDRGFKFATTPGGSPVGGAEAEDIILGRLSEIEEQRAASTTTQSTPKLIITNPLTNTTETRELTKEELPDFERFKERQLRTKLPKLQKGGKIGNIFRDIGNTALNTLATPLEAATGNNFFDPQFKTGVGKGIGRAQDTIGQIGAQVAPTLLNVAIPGAGTALSAGRSLSGVEQGGFDNSLLGEQGAQALGTAASLGSKFFRGGGTVEKLKRVYGHGGGVPIEVEGGEASARPDGSFVEFNGPGHENGGIDVNEPEGSIIIPRSLKVPFDEAVKNGDKLRISSIEQEVLKREKDREIEDVIEFNNKFQAGGGVGRLPELNFGVTPEELPFEAIGGLGGEPAAAGAEGVGAAGGSFGGITASKFGDQALALGPGAFNLASGLLSKPQQVDPIANPFEQQALEKLQGRKINLDPVRRQIGESFSSAKAGIRGAGNISPGAFRSNISNLATQESQALADVELQEQQANLGFQGQEAQALLNIGQNRQKQQLIADQLTRQAKSAKKSQVSQGIEGLQQGFFNLAQSKALGQAFPFAR